MRNKDIIANLVGKIIENAGKVEGGSVAGDGVIVIHGSRATGKTLHRAAFARLYGCETIVEDFMLPRGYRPAAGALVLTDNLRQARARWPAARFVDIDDARRAIGLSPAPAMGFRP